jgi:NAD(P)-dependent dehydrogenase (short-subunit alcohol dehydrogenase family)
MSTLNEIPQPLGKLKGKVAVITGGTTGIGLATAKLFVREGAYVFITGRRQKELDEAVKAIGSNVTGVQGDVAKLADLDRLYETVKAEGRIDIVLANAGIAEFTPLGSIPKRAASFSLSFRVQPEKADDTFVPSNSAELRISTQAGSSPRNLGAKAGLGETRDP